MENQKNDNLNMLEAIVQNTEMGKNTLDQLVPMADNEQFKRSFCASATSTASSIRRPTRHRRLRRLGTGPERHGEA